MNLSEFSDPEAFLYIKTLVALSNRFKVGDYVKLYQRDYNDDDDKMIFVPEIKNIAAFRSQINQNINFNAEIEPIYKVVKSVDGYIEVQPVNPAPEDDLISSYFNEDHRRDITGYHLRNVIEDLYCEIDDDSEVDVDAFVNKIANNMIKLDEDYTDSIIFESTYVPYAGREDIRILVEKVMEAKEKERKELLRLRAYKGHATRRRRKEAAAAKAKEAVVDIHFADIFGGLLKSTSRAKKATKKVSKKRVVKKPTKKVVKVATKKRTTKRKR